MERFPVIFKSEAAVGLTSTAKVEPELKVTSPTTFIVPIELPGWTVPLLVTAPITVPVPLRMAPVEMVTGEDSAPLIASVPAETVVELAALLFVKLRRAEPIFVIVPPPEMAPAKVPSPVWLKIRAPPFVTLPGSVAEEACIVPKVLVVPPV